MNNGLSSFCYVTNRGHTINIREADSVPISTGPTHHGRPEKPTSHKLTLREIFDDKPFAERLLAAIDVILDQPDPTLSQQSISAEVQESTSPTCLLIINCSFALENEDTDTWNVTIIDTQPGEPFHPQWRKAS